MTTMTQHATGMFCWTELATSNPEGAKKFYPALFGWAHEDFPMANGATYTMLRKDGRDVAALYGQSQQDRQRGLGPNWMPYIAVDSADQFAERIKQAGGKVLSEPFDVDPHGRMAVCQDPTTGIFSLWQAKEHRGAGVVNETGSMVWNELITTDAARAAEFYERVFGWTEEKMSVPMGTYTVFKMGTAGAGGMMQATPQMQLTHPYWLAYFAVDDCDASVARAQQLGGKTMLAPTDIQGVGRLAVLTDPQGAYFAVLKPRPA